MHLLFFFFMSLPFFYIDHIDTSAASIALNEETSRHIVQVLRMKAGEQLQLTDGKGNLFTAEVNDNNKKKCAVTLLNTSNIQRSANNITIAISLIKNNSRFEWFLEKATELGVTTIIPLLCERTEKQHFRLDRMKNILVSAMLQSQQCWLPVLYEPTRLGDLVMRQFDDCKKYIAHCEDEKNKEQLHQQINKSSNQLIMIGPEGDFTSEEIGSAIQHHFIPVALGNTRLRTETAGVVVAALLTQLKKSAD